MNEPTFRRRRRRRQSDSSQIDVPLIKPTETETETSSAEPTETNNDNTSSNISQAIVDHETSHQATIDRIRSEIQEDEYHSRLDEPDYSDDSHDWGDDEELTSSDYWHFLGMYE